jgi:hypothetical protein
MVYFYNLASMKMTACDRNMLDNLNILTLIKKLDGASEYS